MPHFLIKKEEIKNDIIELCDNENLFHLIKVLRVKPHQKVKFIDEERNVYKCEIIEVAKNFLKAQILQKTVSDRVLKNNIILLQSILASDSQNLLIANAVQTGVKRIYPVVSDNVSASISSLKGKVEKWSKIADENFKQCERADKVEIMEISNLKDALAKFKKENILIFAEKYENANEEANVVVSAYSEKKAYRIQNKLSRLKHMNHTQHNKR
jgi:16S rRNA (uracil1498-N3)-methyltransferase